MTDNEAINYFFHTINYNINPQKVIDELNARTPTKELFEAFKQDFTAKQNIIIHQKCSSLSWYNLEEQKIWRRYTITDRASAAAIINWAYQHINERYGFEPYRSLWDELCRSILYYKKEKKCNGKQTR